MISRSSIKLYISLVRVCMSVLCLFIEVPSWGRIRLPHTEILSYHWSETEGRRVVVEKSAVADTSYINYPMRSLLYDFSPLNLYNGNIVSPIISGLYFHRTNKTGFFFGRPYDIYTISPEEAEYMSSNVPYSHIGYKRGFLSEGGDNNIDFAFSGDVMRKNHLVNVTSLSTSAIATTSTDTGTVYREFCNLGVRLNYLDGIGAYANQAGRCMRGSVFGSYQGLVKNHETKGDVSGLYGIDASYRFVNMSNFENGGLLGSRGLLTGESEGGFSSLLRSGLDSHDVGVSMQGMSGFSYNSAVLSSYYTFLSRRIDSVVLRVPVFRISHTMTISSSTRRYVEKSVQSFYPANYLNTSATRDTCGWLDISNTIAFSTEEGLLGRKPDKWYDPSLSVYIKNSVNRYVHNALPNYPIGSIELFSIDAVSTSGNELHQLPSRLAESWFDNIRAGATISKSPVEMYSGAFDIDLRYSLNADFCFFGRERGNVDVGGEAFADFKFKKEESRTDKLSVGMSVVYSRTVPDYFLCSFASNHYVWSRSLSAMHDFHLKGVVGYYSRFVRGSLNIDYSTIRNYIYFIGAGNKTAEQLSCIGQQDGQVNVFAAEAKFDFVSPWVNLENHIVCQKSSSAVIPLPLLCLYHNLYYHGTWFKALDAQLGADVSYNTSYYAPFFDPAIGQFVLQNTEKVGNYPMIGVYANFFVRSIKLRFFLRYDHLNTTFMNGDMRGNYFSIPAYPLNPGMFRAGLAFHFYN